MKIKENGLLWRLGQFAVISILGLGMFAVPWGLAMFANTIKDFLVGLL